MLLAPSETKMWKKKQSINGIDEITDEEINAKYAQGESKILIEMNREKLPSFAESSRKNKYMDISPFYQRRPRWDAQKQSRLIESFLINIPVPPIILYENDYNTYEVMDGQQRITAIRDFYENKLVLTGLEIWPEINGRKYQNLPTKIKAGIDRRSISSIVILTESTSNQEEAFILKQLTFERINTGGVLLSNQEVRNCLYHGKFNSLLHELANNKIFADAWDIPIESKENLAKNNLYKKMEDVELVLRFFALRHVNEFRQGMKGFLDIYMIKSRDFSDEDVQVLGDIFLETINLAAQVYEKNLFKAYDLTKETWTKESYKAYYDAVMVGFSNHLDSADILLKKKEQILEATKQLFINDTTKLFTGGAKTKKAIQDGIQSFSDMLSQIIEE